LIEQAVSLDSLLVIPTEEEAYNLLWGQDDDDGRKPKKNKGKKPDDDEDDDEGYDDDDSGDDEDDEDEVDAECPSDYEIGEDFGAKKKCKRCKKHHPEVYEYCEVLSEQLSGSDDDDDNDNDDDEDDEGATADSCPFDYIFGAEHDKYQSCIDCDEDIFDACEEEQSRIKAEKKKKGKGKKK